MTAKCTSSILSPAEAEATTKKPNLDGPDPTEELPLHTETTTKIVD